MSASLENGGMEKALEHGHKVSVLLVDDQQMIGEAVRRMLDDEKDVTFHYCQDSESALSAARDVSPTVILQDLVMPKKNGLELVKEYRSDPATKDVPLIVLSSENDAKVKAEAFALGANDYLVKLPDRLELVARIRQHSRAYINMLERNEAFEAMVRTQKALAESESRYRELFEHMSGGVVVLNAVDDGGDFVLEDVNHASQRMGGMSKDEVVGRRLTEVLASARESGLFDAIRDVWRTGKPKNMIISIGGEWHEDSIYKLPGGEVIIYYDDITERKRAEMELQKAHNTLAAILSNVPVGIAILGLEREVLWLNKTAVKMLEMHSMEDIVGRKIDASSFAGGTAKAPPQGSEFSNLERTLLSTRGGSLPILQSSSKATIQDMPVMIDVFVDISEQKKAEREKKIMEARLHQAQKFKSIGQLAAGMAHEINTPVQFIGDNLRFVRDAFSGMDGVIKDLERLDGGTSKDIAAVKEKLGLLDMEFLRKEVCSAIEQSSDGVGRIAKIVSAMKEFARDSGSEATACDLNRMIEDVVTISENKWSPVADLRTDLHPGVLEALCLRVEISQVLLNLVVNATEAVEKAVGEGGKEKGLIQITSRLEDGFARVSVSDSGPGVPEEIKDRVFDPFFTTKGVGEGSGQGLAISYDIVVSKHKGELSFVSGKDGTTFTMRIPVGRSAGTAGKNVEKRG